MSLWHGIKLIRVIEYGIKSTVLFLVYVFLDTCWTYWKKNTLASILSASSNLKEYGTLLNTDDLHKSIYISFE